LGRFNIGNRFSVNRIGACDLSCPSAWKNPGIALKWPQRPLRTTSIAHQGRGSIYARSTTYGLVAAAVITAVLLIGVLVDGLAQGADWYQWWPHVSKSHIKQFIGSAGIWGVGASIGLMVLHSFVPFPAELVAITNGMIYGPIWGTVITWVGAMLGAFAAFGLARVLGQRFVRQVLTEKNAQNVDDWVASHGPGALLFSRFIPVIAFNLINYAAGLTKISWWHFAWTTGVGILPLTMLMVVMGDQIETLPWQAWVLLLGAGLIVWWGMHRFLPAVAATRSR